MIGSKRETVTKAFTLLQHAGAVELKRRRIHVGDIEGFLVVRDTSAFVDRTAGTAK